MLNYFWSTATTNDCLVAGPSGAGYTRINYWGVTNVAAYTKVSSEYLQRDGIQAITVWLTVSSATANTYATNCPTLLGISDQSDGYYSTSDKALPVMGFPSTGNYATTTSNLLNAITNAAAGWNGSAPMFIAVQGDAWDVRPTNCQAVVNFLNSNYVVVRPDHLFLLYREANGLGAAGALPYVTQGPASLSAIVGTNITFNVYAGGTGPLSYQWQMDGANIPNATGSTFSKANVQLTDAGNYQVVIANSYGSTTSSIAALTFGSQPVGFNGNGLDWTISQDAGYAVYATPTITNNVLTLTDGNGGEARSCFFQNPQYIGAFETAFTYQAGGNKGADGITFCLQNDPRGALAIGGSGGQLGVGTSASITPSVELELDIYSPHIGYGFNTNGITGVYSDPGNVNMASGDPINITMVYANGQLALTFTDAVANTSFSTNFAINLADIVGTNDAYVGFTGGDGAATSIQTISNFEFISVPSETIQASGTNALISWPYVPGYVLQQNSDLTTTNWVNVTNQSLLTNQPGQYTVPMGNSSGFYRLVLPSSP
jgi:hypothetical protein